MTPPPTVASVAPAAPAGIGTVTQLAFTVGYDRF